MRRYVLTGAPGAGKTSVLGALRGLGLAVVPEAATDVIGAEQRRGVAEPWLRDGFVDKILRLQLDRLAGAASAAGAGCGVEVHDRSPLCTLALARYLGRPPTPLLTGEVARICRDRVFEPAVFLIRPLGFIEPTAARRISYEQSLEFEGVHEAVYREHGFELIDVAPAGVAERAGAIAARIAALG
jgi:predicted ATPase